MIRNELPAARHRLQSLAGLLAVWIGLFMPATSIAFSFMPTPAEWALWPDYCKARFVVSEIGKTSPYVSMVPPAMVQMWRTRLGTPTFTPLHHHCAGIVHMQRARFADTDERRRHEYRSAERESRYTLERIPPTSPLYREVLVNVQMAKAMAGSL